MNGKDLLMGLGDIGQKYYDEGETGKWSGEKQGGTFRRPVLIAAVIALTALLVGCAVVYSLRLQDLSIGKETYTQSFDEDGRAIEPVEKTKDILTMYGHGGDAIQKASAEWYAFLEAYDPEGALMNNVSDLPEIPNQFEYVYNCYTPDMVSKVEEIAQKFDLKLLEERIVIQQYQSEIFLEETGIRSLLLPDSGAETEHMAGMLYLPGNFQMEFTLRAEGVDRLYADYSYADRAYFPQEAPGGLDLSNYEQWDHNAPDGTALLLALSSKGHGIILAESDRAIIRISVHGNLSNSLYPDESDIISKSGLERIADVFDYSIRPRVSDTETMEALLAETEEAYQAEHAYVPERYGSFAQYLMEKVRVPDEKLQYTFYDLTGDGEEELLIGHDGAYTEWLTLRDGETRTRMVLETYLCEGGVEERYSAYEIYETHMYLAPLSETAVDDIEAERQVLTYLRREGDQWTRSHQEFSPDRRAITGEEARAVMAGYPRMELNWKPLMDYPVDEGGMTLRVYLEEKDIRLSSQELADLYKERLSADKDLIYTHYRLLDINADGVEDLLLSGNGEYFWQAVTYRYGSVVTLNSADFYLCGDGILENVSQRWDRGVEMTGQRFVRLEGFEKTDLDFLVYNKATASWQPDWHGGVVPEAEAQEILAKYQRIDQGMMTIEEFLS